MKKKTMALLVAGLVASTVSGSFVLGFAGLVTAGLVTGVGLLAFSVVLFVIGCYQFWKKPVKKPEIFDESLLEASYAKVTLETSAEQNSTQLYCLPKEIFPNVSTYLNQQDQNAFAASSQTLFGFLKKDHLLEQLLEAVVYAEQEKVINILLVFPELAVKQRSFTELNGRHFPNVSLVELVRWHGNLRCMANAILDVLLYKSNEAIIIEWVNQYKAYDDRGGLNYVVHGESKMSLGFSSVPLVERLSFYIDNHQNMSPKERSTYLKTNVHTELNLPFIFVWHCCLPNLPFAFTKPSFDKSLFSKALTIYQSIARRPEHGYIPVTSIPAIRNFHYHVMSGQVRSEHLERMRACEDQIALDLIAFKTRLIETLNEQPTVESNYRP